MEFIDACEVSGLDQFYQDHPLNLLGRDQSQPQAEKVQESERDPEEKVELDIDDLPSAPTQDLMRFCVEHHLQVGHDTERDELLQMAKWVINNEADGVLFSTISSMMQQAIDLSVLPQHTMRMESGTAEPKSFSSFIEKSLCSAEKMTSTMAASRREAGELTMAAINGAQDKIVAEFQRKVVETYIASQQGEAKEEN